MASTCPLSSQSNLTEGLLAKARKGSHRSKQRKVWVPKHGPPSSPARSSSSSSSSLAAGEMTVFDGVAIIAGTAIGGGFLALPTLTTPMGFMPATTGLFVSWAFLVMTALAYAEATLRSMVKQSSARAADAAFLEAAADELPECSVLTVTRCSLGNGCSMICSAAFATLMFVVMTAQVVKSGEIVSLLSGLPYSVSCIIPSLLAGLFSYCASTRTVEQANSALTVALVVGFALLIFNTTVAGTTGMNLSTVARRLSFADWRWLMPTGPSWTLPVFVNLICFGQAVPVIVGRFGPGRVRDVQISIVLGSFIPFLLCALWVAVSAALVDAKASGEAVASDPVLRMLRERWAVSVPVGLVALGAIGTSLISSCLSLGQFFTDCIFAICGRCTLNSRGAARTAVVVIPLIVACGGPELYLPLLAFAGAYPTDFLYGIVPCLATLALRRAEPETKSNVLKGSLRLLPGGYPLLISLGFLAAALIATSAALSLG